jgi:hypothetical protein
VTAVGREGRVRSVLSFPVEFLKFGVGLSHFASRIFGPPTDHKRFRMMRRISGRGGRGVDLGIDVRDLGYALAASSCEGAHSVEYAPSRPLMRSLLSQFQTPTTPRRAVGFFGSGHSPGHPSDLITQLTLDWLRFILANPFTNIDCKAVGEPTAHVRPEEWVVFCHSDFYAIE